MGARRTVWTGVARAATVAAAVVLVITGCAPRRPVGGEPVSDGPVVLERQWTCLPLAGPGADQLAGRAESWTVEGGNMLSAHRTRHEEPGLPGRTTQGNAMADAAECAADAALELLSQRGVAYDEERRRGIVDDVVGASVRGAGIVFPRMAIVARGWEECVAVAEDTAAGPDTIWRAAILVEYPIRYLRGDVNNVLWERGRAANEAEVLRASAEDHLSAGRWHDGLLDAARIARVVLATGVPTTGAPTTIVDDARESTATRELISIDARLRELLRWARFGARAAETLAARAAGAVDVVEVGAAADAIVEFHCTYEWNGATIPAVGVPVRFDMPGASAVLDVDPLTDESGTATCRIVAAYGPPGAYELMVRLDLAAAHAAVSRPPGSAGVPLDPADALPALPSGPVAHGIVHLVAGAHAISVCAQFGDRPDGDAAQVMSGFTRRMERDGYRMGACDPGVAVVVTGAFSLSTHGGQDSWTAEVVLSASAFDQRTASELGATRITATETVDVEDSEDGRREAEVLALKEAGRLLAVYFGARILASGR